MAVDAGTMDGLRDLMVALLDSIRRDALEHRLNRYTQYDQITSRIQIAARTASTIGEWATDVLHRLQVTSPSNSVCYDLRAMELGIAEAAKACSMPVVDVTAELLDMVCREHGLMIARLRLAADARRALYEKRKAEQTAIDAEEAATAAAPAAEGNQ